LTKYIIKKYKLSKLLDNNFNNRIEQINNFDCINYKSLVKTTLSIEGENLIYSQKYFKKIKKNLCKNDLTELVKTLEYLNEIHFVHGDINKKNIIFTNEGLKLIDYEPSLVQLKEKETIIKVTIPYIFKDMLYNRDFSSEIDKLGFIYFLLRQNHFINSRDIINLQKTFDHYSIIKLSFNDLKLLSYQDLVDYVYHELLNLNDTFN